VKIKNKVKEITCNNCGCNKAELAVGTRKDFFEDVLGINAGGVMVDGTGRVHSLKGEIIKSHGFGICPGCGGDDDEETDVTVTFRDGTVIDQEEDPDYDGIIAHWMAPDGDVPVIPGKCTVFVDKMDGDEVEDHQAAVEAAARAFERGARKVTIKRKIKK
jgi:hypothetical protein